jgi:putative transposase
VVAVAALIAAQRDEHRVPHAAACRALGVSRSWFYKWKDGALTPRAARRQALAAEVRRLFAAHRGTYGSPPITADLRAAGWKVSENTVAALMREQGLAARRKKKRRSTTRPGKGRWRAPDLVKRDFPAKQVNRKWYGDGTEIRTGEGKLYLASVMDMASRRVLGYALGEHHDAQLAYSALVMAVAVRGGQVSGVIMHTDRGSRVHSRPGPAGLRPAGHRPVHGPARVRAGQRGHRVLALHPGIRAPLPRGLQDQGRSPHAGQRLDRGLQHQAAALRAGHDVPGRL